MRREDDDDESETFALPNLEDERRSDDARRISNAVQKKELPNVSELLLQYYSPPISPSTGAANKTAATATARKTSFFMVGLSGDVGDVVIAIVQEDTAVSRSPSPSP